MWNFVENIPRDSLDSWFRWLTLLTIVLPVLGAILGAVCGWGAFVVSNRIGDLQTADLRQAQQTISRQNTEIEHLKPWSLSETQANTLRAGLSSFSPGTVAFAYRLMDGEGKGFADQLSAIFKTPGWSIGGSGGSSLNTFTGITVAIDAASSNAALRQTANRLCDLFTKVGIHCGADLVPHRLGGPIAPGTILIIIGTKPDDSRLDPMGKANDKNP
jgi:hypothetical protein